LHQDNALIILNIPCIGQIVDALAPLVNKQGRRLRVSWLDPIWKEISLFCLIPKILVEVCISNFLERLDIINRN